MNTVRLKRIELSLNSRGLVRHDSIMTSVVASGLFTVLKSRSPQPFLCFANLQRVGSNHTSPCEGVCI